VIVGVLTVFPTVTCGTAATVSTGGLSTATFAGGCKYVDAGFCPLPL